MNKKKLFSFDMFKNIKTNYSLLPITMLASFGLAAGVFTMSRTLMRSPDVIVDRVNNPKPYEHWKDKQYRFFRQTIEKNDTNERPKIFDD